MKRRELLKAAAVTPLLPLLLRSGPASAKKSFIDAAGEAPRVRLIAPSGWPDDLAAMTRGVSRLRKAGFVVEGESVLKRVDTRFAGTDAQRAHDINALASMDRLPDIALATRGGYGLTRLLRHLHYDALRERLHGRHLALVGHSDFTALQLALYAKTGLISFAGPLLTNLGAAPLEQQTWKDFCATLGSASYSVSWSTPYRSELHVQGPLWGGNLTMLASLVGTPYFPHIDGGILFVEDVSEVPFRIERTLYQLYLSGALERQRALLLGNFLKSEVGPSDNGYNLDMALDQISRVIGIPVVRGLPHGHGRRQLTLPFGAPAKVQVQSGHATLSFSGYPKPYSKA